jgi:hypothetical protein
MRNLVPTLFMLAVLLLAACAQNGRKPSRSTRSTHWDKDGGWVAAGYNGGTVDQCEQVRHCAGHNSADKLAQIASPPGNREGSRTGPGVPPPASGEIARTRRRTMFGEVGCQPGCFG